MGIRLPIERFCSVGVIGWMCSVCLLMHTNELGVIKNANHVIIIEFIF